MVGLLKIKSLTIKILCNPHLWIVTILVMLLSVIHYHEALTGAGFIREIGYVLGLGLSRHSLERILFLIPVAYGLVMLSVRGGLITLVIAAAILFPRAFFFSPEPREALFETGGIIFTGALLVSLVYTLQKKKQQTTELETAQRMLDENMELQINILRRNRELQNLNEIARDLCRTLDLEIVVHSAAEAILNTLEAEVSWVQLIDDASGAPTTCVNNGVSAEAVDKLIENARSLASTRKTDKSIDYFTLPNVNSGNYDQTPWYAAVTSLKSKEIVLGIAGVATTKLPFDKQHIQLLNAIGNQLAGAVERCKLYAEVQLARDVRGELLRKIITTQEEERKRIARELHDETCQSLTALRLGIEGLVSASASRDEGFREQILQYCRLCEQIQEEIDKIILDLRPTLLDDLGLIEAIRFYTNIRFRTAGIFATVKVIGKERRLSNEIEAAVFRVTQECISNIVKHSRAAHVTIELQYNVDELTVRIEDDGCGFEVTGLVSPRNSKHGMGLLGMKERISLVGGSLSVVSAPGAGTFIEVAVSVTEQEAYR